MVALSGDSPGKKSDNIAKITGIFDLGLGNPLIMFMILLMLSNKDLHFL
jgi:hypothetical protein